MKDFKKALAGLLAFVLVAGSFAGAPLVVLADEEDAYDYLDYEAYDDQYEYANDYLDDYLNGEAEEPLDEVPIEEEAVEEEVLEEEVLEEEVTEEVYEEIVPITAHVFAADEPSDWALAYVLEALDAGILPFALQSQFTAPINRAEYAALSVALFESVRGEITERAEFYDTQDLNVQKLGGINVVMGFEGNFNPGGLISREEAAAFMARLAREMGQPLPLVAPTFNDNASISDWAVEYVGQVAATGIMGGLPNNMFDPSGQYTREQAIVTMVRLLRMVPAVVPPVVDPMPPVVEELPDDLDIWGDYEYIDGFEDFNDVEDLEDYDEVENNDMDEEEAEEDDEEENEDDDEEDEE